VICLPASRSPSDLPPATCCWTVFIVSNGASIVLEQAAARPEASVFLSPSVTAEDDFLGADVVVVEAVGDALLVRPPRGMWRTLGLAGWMPLPLAMLNNLADAGTVREQRRNRESRSAAFILDKVIGLDMAQTLD